MLKVDRKVLQLEAKKELARREFFSYCNMMAPDFYREDRKYLVELCTSLQEFMDSEDDVLIINEPPRHGKSRTAGKYVEWVLGRDHKKKIMTGSYNETLSTTFSKNVRNTIAEVKADKDKIIYSDIFGHTSIKQGDGAMNLWSLSDGYNNYLATSPTGTATGFGADLIIIDDLIKSALEANNANVLEGHWDWFINTMLSRLEANGKIIIIMTRWHSNDLAGRALEELPKSGYKVKHLSMKAKQTDGSMLCSDILSEEEYMRKVSTMGVDIAAANYQQEPIDIKGRLYSSFKTYTDIPRDANGRSLLTSIRSYTDTADEGSDFLCSIIYGVYRQEAYILDVYYTQDPMELTEKEVAKRHHELKVNNATIESNNGGRGFARNVIRILTDVFRSNRCIVRWFHQSKNKKARILTNASWVMEHIYFPVECKDDWTEFYKHLIKYQKEGKNDHDDAEDCITGIAEELGVQEGVVIG